jgi:hypothetical protein
MRTTILAPPCGVDRDDGEDEYDDDPEVDAAAEVDG